MTDWIKTARREALRGRLALGRFVGGSELLIEPPTGKRYHVGHVRRDRGVVELRIGNPNGAPTARDAGEVVLSPLAARSLAGVLTLAAEQIEREQMRADLAEQNAEALAED